MYVLCSYSLFIVVTYAAYHYHIPITMITRLILLLLYLRVKELYTTPFVLYRWRITDSNR
jgi:hypothetical protein